MSYISKGMSRPKSIKYAIAENSGLYKLEGVIFTEYKIITNPKDLLQYKNEWNEILNDNNNIIPFISIE
jgi:hypothetical protein